MQGHDIPSDIPENALKPTYTRPKAIFVPLKLEERLLACGKREHSEHVAMVVVPNQS